MHPFIPSKHKEINDKTCLSYGQQQQWEVVPPYQLLESAQTMLPQDPGSCSWYSYLRTGGACK